MNPWLALPLGDYKGHMRSPASVAILGIAGGNGLEHVDPSVTSRGVGLDLNPQYPDVTRLLQSSRR